MPEVTDQPAKPLRTWRPMVLWTAGILLALGSAWFATAVVRSGRAGAEALKKIRGGEPKP
jgi:hypothetical protein